MKKYIILSALVLPLAAQARPVSYPDGWTVMSMNDWARNSVHVHYSPTAKYSVGYKGEYWREGGSTFQGGQVNNLLKRWNGPDFQGNLYLKTALGAARGQGEESPAGFSALAADWEDRRWFTSYSARVQSFGGVESPGFMQNARVGVAPYVGAFGALHTWLMLQVDHVPEQKKPVQFTPLIRFFKGTTLVEAGVNLEKGVMFNLIQRF